MKVKICGLTTRQDSLHACQAGADMLGFNFYSGSARMIEPDLCAEIVAQVKQEFPKVRCVGVFVDHTLEKINAIMETCDLDLAQLSGNEPRELIEALDGKAFKAFRPQNIDAARESIAQLPARITPPAFLIDAYKKGHYGGTGKTANWELAAEIAKDHAILLAGGLNPDNITAAIGRVGPWGLDVASGVEREPGIKDPDKVRAFIELSHRAAGENQYTVETHVENNQ